jgi:hypothetical protein
MPSKRFQNGLAQLLHWGRIYWCIGVALSAGRQYFGSIWKNCFVLRQKHLKEGSVYPSCFRSRALWCGRI